MSLKEEMEKIIRSEREKLKSQDRKDKEYWDCERERFRPMRALLEEVVGAVDPEHVEVKFSDQDATIEVGTRRPDSDCFEEDMRWKVRPNFGVRLNPQMGEGLFEEKPGFQVEETITCRSPEFDSREKTHTFSTESETVQFIIRKMAEKIAHYQHITSLQHDRQDK
jgi:hypothetical protein